jgi:hypothetical protein
MQAEPSSLPECPKCSHRRTVGGESCPRCGLTFALWVPPADAAPLRLDEEGEALWAACLASWEAEDRHDAFVKHCSLTGALAIAGRRYRERLDQQPMDPVAGRMQGRILAMATASFVRPATTAVPVTRTTGFWLVLVLFAVVGMAAAFYLRHR